MLRYQKKTKKQKEIKLEFTFKVQLVYIRVEPGGNLLALEKRGVENMITCVKKSKNTDVQTSQEAIQGS